MSTSHLGFRTSAPVRPDGRKVAFLDWVYQPPKGRMQGTQPQPEDSSAVTIDFYPHFEAALPSPQDTGGFYIDDMHIELEWSAAGEAKLLAEIDLQRGTKVTLIATSIKASVVYSLGLDENLAARASRAISDLFPGLRVDATLGRGTRASTLEQPVRTRRLGVVQGAGGQSPVVVIPPFSRSVAVTTKTGPYNLVGDQFSGAALVQTDTLVGPQPTLAPTIDPSATDFRVTNSAVGVQVLSAVFRIGL